VTDSTAGRCGGNPNDSQDNCWTASLFGEIVSMNYGVLESNNDVSGPRSCKENGCGTVEETGASGCTEREDGVHGHGVVCGGECGCVFFSPYVILRALLVHFSFSLSIVHSPFSIIVHCLFYKNLSFAHKVHLLLLFLLFLLFLLSLLSLLSLYFLKCQDVNG